MKSILKKIVLAKKKEVQAQKKLISQSQLIKKVALRKLRVIDFKKNICVFGKISCIGELKKASPSRGIFKPQRDILKTARLYQASGVRAISVLTDKHFKGKLRDLTKVKKAVGLPVLRKDFIIDEYQLYQSYCAGADAVLLIAAILKSAEISRFLDVLKDLGIPAIVEVHSRRDIEKVNFEKTQIIGINNRNLNTFKVSLATTSRLRKLIPLNKLIVSESGIFNRKDMLKLKKSKINAVLVGEGIISAPDMKLKIKELIG